MIFLTTIEWMEFKHAIFNVKLKTLKMDFQKDAIANRIYEKH